MNEETRTVKPEEISVFDIYRKTRIVITDIIKKWKAIVLFVLLGAGLGLCYSVFKKPDYTAVCTFVLDDNDKGSILGQYAGLASMAGIDIGGNANGIFKGDNIFALYTSRLMLEKTLLSEIDINGKKQKLINIYINYNKLLEKWKDRDNIQSINFEGNPASFNRTQDSLISDITETFNKKYLDVSKPDKKLSVIQVSFVSKNELFAKEFTDKLVETVNNLYIINKTKKALKNVRTLQQQADSVRKILNSSLNGVASAMDASPNANPALLSLKLPSQKKQIDVQTNSGIYGAIVNNLEAAKLSLSQQTPLIEYLDQPVYPLKSSRIKILSGMLIGAAAGFILTVIILLIRKVLNSVVTAAA